MDIDHITVMNETVNRQIKTNENHRTCVEHCLSWSWFVPLKSCASIFMSLLVACYVLMPLKVWECVATNKAVNPKSCRVLPNKSNIRGLLSDPMATSYIYFVNTHACYTGGRGGIWHYSCNCFEIVRARGPAWCTVTSVAVWAEYDYTTSLLLQLCMDVSLTFRPAKQLSYMVKGLLGVHVT